jgi:cyclin E
MRSILYDWISEVCKEFTLKRETFHLCVHNLDRYMSKIQIAKSELQLLGLASLYIACKIEVSIIKM